MRKGSIICFIAAILLFLSIHTEAYAATNVIRLAGRDRYETAIAVSQDGWSQSEYMVLASGEDFPDAICATPLAKAYNAPILLSNKKELGESMWSEFQRLGVKNVFIVGGTGVIPTAIENSLKAKGMTVTRLGGKDRYETAVKVAQEVEKTAKVDKIVLVQGRDYAGAVAIASIAANDRMPILLSDKNALDPAVAQYFKGKSIEKSYIVGGTDLLSSAVEKAVANSIRIDGKDKYAVNFSILKTFGDEYKYDQVYMTTGENYPDALTASASAAKTTAPVLLVNTTLLKDMEDFINSKISSSNQLKLIGGEAVLPLAAAQGIIKKEEPPKVPDVPKTDPGTGTGNNKELVICLDAGDGNSKQENIGQAGTREKDVNLAVTLKAGKILEDNGVKVVYTRTADYLPWDSESDLANRFKISNDAQADFFISIHCNAFTNPDTRGVETYYADGAANGKLLASYIQDKVVSAIGEGAINRGIKTGTQAELQGTNAVGVKVYLGFITNSQDENLLRDESSQDKYAKAIADAVLKYKQDNNKSGTVQTMTPEDVMATVYQGESYNLPESVNLVLPGGSKKSVAVSWTNSSFDTNQPGVYICEGSIAETVRKVYAAITVLKKSSNNGFIVTIDAGHGGYDPGALGPTGVQEKDITLKVALKTANILAQNGVNVVYTRVSDNVLWPPVELDDLKMRCAISDRAKANLFVSIHNNSFTDPNASGIETYYSENSDKGKALASTIQKQLVATNGLLDRKIKTAGYYVLKNTDAPSTLTELAFISNPQEEKLLNSEDFQNKCAAAIANGILADLKQ